MADEDKSLQSPVQPIEEMPQASTEAPSDSSPALESGKEEANNLPESSQEEGLDEVEKLRRDYSASSKEARILKEEKERAEALLRDREEQLLNFAAKDKQTFQEYLDMRGLSPEEKAHWMNVYETQVEPTRKGTASGVSQQATEPQQPMAPLQPPANPIRESWMSKVDQEYAAKFQAQREASVEFFNREDMKEIDPIERQAIIAQAELFDLKYGYSPKEALEAARQRVLSPDEEKDRAYVEGVRDTFAGGISRGISGSGGKKGSAFTLPKKHQAFVEAEIQRKGLSGKQAEDYREAYALKVARDSE